VAAGEAVVEGVQTQTLVQVVVVGLGHLKYLVQTI
jgi:hypothetical protein